MQEYVSVAVSALISAAVSGVAVFALQRWMISRFDAAATEKKESDDFKRRKRIGNDNLRKCAGKLFFWIVRVLQNCCTTRSVDCEAVEKALLDYNNAEAELDAIDQEIVADFQKRR